MKTKHESNSNNNICGICTLGQQNREAETKSREKEGEILSVVPSDICDTIETPSLKGEQYFITFTDETTGRVSIGLLCLKDQAIVAFQADSTRAEKTRRKEIKSLWSDSGGEYINHWQGFKEYLESAEIQNKVSTPYSPVQNCLVELMNRKLVASARYVLENSKLKNEFWGSAILTAGHIHNRLPSRSHGDLSSIQHSTAKSQGLGTGEYLGLRHRYLY